MKRRRFLALALLKRQGVKPPYTFMQLREAGDRAEAEEASRIRRAQSEGLTRIMRAQGTLPDPDGDHADVGRLAEG